MLSILRKITPAFLLNWYHFLWSFMGALIYGFPAKGMIVIGVTGTNGKSTTVEMISRIFKEAGLNVASMSSLRFLVKDKEWKNTMKMTMPGRFVIQKFLRQAKDAGCTHMVLEVTSEGILQHRHRFIPFHTAVFTNLSPEHIERHGSFKNYKKTKGKLFSITKEVHVINTDDEHASFFIKFPAKKTYTYSILNQIKDKLGIRGEDVRENGGLGFLVENTRFNLHLLGDFNVYNALSAILVARSQGISLEICKSALEKIQVIEGRMEEVISSPFRVVVDYAFTPAALKKVYKTLKPQNQGKLICVVGSAGGGRDKWKRPVLGKIAATYCDQVFVTDEDPYEEDPWQIIEQVAAGTNGKGQKIQDRREAIKEALKAASAKDVVIITGKGSEDSIAVKGGKKIPWDDRKVVREEWTKLKERGTL